MCVPFALRKIFLHKIAVVNSVWGWKTQRKRNVRLLSLLFYILLSYMYIYTAKAIPNWKTERKYHYQNCYRKRKLMAFGYIYQALTSIQWNSIILTSLYVPGVVFCYNVLYQVLSGFVVKPINFSNSLRWFIWNNLIINE